MKIFLSLLVVMMMAFGGMLNTAQADNSVRLSLYQVDSFATTDTWAYEMEVDLPDVTGVTGVSVTTPTTTLNLFNYGDETWSTDELSGFSSFANLDSAIDGTWTIDIAGTNASNSSFTVDTSANTALSAGDFFSPATPSTPSPNATDVPRDVTLTWTDPTGGTADVLVFILDSQDVDQNFDAVSIDGDIAPNATSYTPGTLLAESSDFEWSVSFIDAGDPLKISDLTVNSGAITWGDAGFPGWPSARPLLTYGSFAEETFSTIPEPATLALLGIGTTLCIARKRKA